MTATQLTGSGGYSVSFRRNDNDRRKPRQVVTKYLLGDPDPSRFERDAVARRRLAELEARRPPAHLSPKVVAVVRALADGPMTFADLGAAMGVNQSTTSGRISAARGGALVYCAEPRGELRRYGLTDRGLQVLTEIGR